MFTGNELREMFLRFFADKGHTRQPSASLIPRDDPTLLLTVAGMVPFKPYFMRKVEPPFSRAVTSQKCVRTPDLEVVGRTARHHTFFEMLGNFSFGDYFKKDAIHWAWEYVTEVLRIEPERLWVTVYPADEEARALWLSETSIRPERILTDETNFWAAGPTGPCGPCSEIYVDQGAARGCDRPECAVGCDCDRYLEIWNLVFMQYDRAENGELTPLPRQNIDTGMGLERIASVMQGVDTNFDTDLFLPLIEKTAELAAVRYKTDARTDTALKVVADHARAVCFMLADGISPASDGRGYVLRRILRRAVRYAKMLGIAEPFLERLYYVVRAGYGEHYSELPENEHFILSHLRLEEKNFQATLDQGTAILQQKARELLAAGQPVLNGADTFHLYETYGFPAELTAEILAEQGLAVDMPGFHAAEAEHRRQARNQSKQMRGAGENPALLEQTRRFGATPFAGYALFKLETEILALFDREETTAVQENETAWCVLGQTPFFAESGGQVSDTGLLTAPGAAARVTELRRLPSGLVLHKISIQEGVLRAGAKVTAQVDERPRRSVSRNHTATHLLHRALREILGDHVQQAGSLVTPERLRFDFTHFAPLTPAELRAVELRVNDIMFRAMSVRTREMPLAEARAQGAAALFGEKYGETVRVVFAGGYSKELCGGTHVTNTGEIGSLKILSESGVGAGLRRIEAVTGFGALDYMEKLEQEIAAAEQTLKAGPQELSKRALAVMAEMRELERETRRLRERLAKYEADDIMTQVKDVNGVQVLAARVQVGDMDALRRMADTLKDRWRAGGQAGVIVLGAAENGKVNLVAAVLPEGLRGLHAGKLIKEVAAVTGGGGGGRADMAQAGGKDPAKLAEALDKTPQIVRRHLLEQEGGALG
ncbi:MAG: alanine--tRNA ligase [Gracilibacteraceae bacterium]|jgi:alanyl-tRNA synthetase|nr:alanine--tRNA ligase [Gracilibacteraceae bacterium]